MKTALRHSPTAPADHIGLPMHPMDDDIVADLRERGMVGPISADFIAEVRRGRRLVELAKRVEATTGGSEKFKRALIRIGILPPEGEGDGTLIAAWESFKIVESDTGGSGVEQAEYHDVPLDLIWDASEKALLFTPATTIKGAIIKLRRFLLLSASDKWVTRAIMNDDDTTLFARVEEFDASEHLVADALAALTLVQEPGGEKARPNGVDPLSCCSSELDALIAQHDAALIAFNASSVSPDEGEPLENAYHASLHALDGYEPQTPHEFTRLFASRYRDGLPPGDDAIIELVAIANRLTGTHEVP
ncbi:MAG: hypothetical protein JWO65_1919 [Sphingomonas bacterium]|nr:hypothetical protein [Sphingomonas bacterium]